MNAQLQAPAMLPLKRTIRAHWIGNGTGPRDYLNAVDSRMISASSRNLTPATIPVAFHYGS
jgi:hypothetical protein